MYSLNGHKTTLKPWQRIGFNLLIAFAVVALTTGVLVTMAWNSLGQLGNQLSHMANAQFPEVVLATKMTRLSSSIRSDAAAMVVATSRGELQHAWLDLSQHVNQLETLIKRSSSRSNPVAYSHISKLLQSTRSKLDRLKKNVDHRLELAARIANMVERLRWLQADFVDEVRPLVTDMRFQMHVVVSDLKAIKNKNFSANAAAVDRFRHIFARQTALMRTSAAANLILGLLMRSANTSSLDELAATRRQLTRPARSLGEALDALSDDTSAVSLRQYGSEILSFVHGPKNFLSIQRLYLTLTRNSSTLLAQSRNTLDQLDTAVGTLVITVRQHATKATHMALARVAHDRFALALGMLVVLLISAGTGWLYVQRRVVRRLHALRSSMLSIAAGDLDAQIQVSRDDEISAMAKALVFFRDTAREVEYSIAQSLIDNTIIGLVSTDVDGRIEVVNQMAQRLFRFGDQDVIGKSFTATFLAGNVQSTFTISQWARRTDVLFHETKGRRFDGEEFYLDIAIRVYYRRDQKKYLITFVDATERHHARSLLETEIASRTTDLEIANSQLKVEMQERSRAEEELIQAAKLAVLGQVAAELAHELNQPLSAVSYNVHNAREFIKLERYSEASHALNKSAIVAARIGRIISHLKTFARRPEKKLGPVMLEQCMDSALMLFEEHISNRKIHLRRNTSSSSIQVYAERTLLEQVLVNVISNALDAAEDSKMPCVELSESVQDDRVHVKVTDNGNGIDDSARQHLFEPFFTTKTNGSGLGLGLSTTRKIVRDLGGDIELESRRNGGTVVKLTFKNADNLPIKAHS